MALEHRLKPDFVRVHLYAIYVSAYRLAGAAFCIYTMCVCTSRIGGHSGSLTRAPRRARPAPSDLMFSRDGIQLCPRVPRHSLIFFAGIKQTPLQTLRAGNLRVVWEKQAPRLPPQGSIGLHVKRA